MAERVCIVCNKKKNMEGGKICERGHFVCRSCVYTGGFIRPDRTHCPTDKTKLR